MADAEFFPRNLPEHIRKDYSRGAEVETFDALKRKAPPDFYIFYNCDWIDPRENPVPTKDGEADFVIAHHTFGFICLEVKGGDVRRNGETKEWYRQLKNSKKKIKNPVAQAKNSKFVILELLKRKWPRGQMPYIKMCHGVILPHLSRPKNTEDFGADMPISRFAFKDDMTNLWGAISIMMLEKEGNISSTGELGSIGINLLKELFTKDIRLDVKLNSVLDVFDNRITDNTHEQVKFLEFSKNFNRAIVIGGAGTGKTFLAIKKAKEFANSSKKTLLLYYNEAIAKFCKQKLADYENIKVLTFHQLCSLCLDNKKVADFSISDREKFDDALPNLLIESISNGKAPTFDAIIIDEAQDLRQEWLEAVMFCLTDVDHGDFYLFKDDNQKIYKNENSSEDLFKVSPFTLTKNVRNTEKIFRFAENYYSGVTNDVYDFDGPEVKLINIKDQLLSKTLWKYLSQLMSFEGVPAEKIAVLSFKSREKSEVFGMLNDKSVPASSPVTKGKFTFDSVYRFKGLERQLVVLVDLDAIIISNELLYVAMSRARTFLVIMGNEDQLAEFERISEVR